MTRVVARYCRIVLAAEGRAAPPAIMAQAAALEDRLGLNPRAMRTLMWEVPEDELAEQRAANADTKSTRTSDVKRRIRAV